MVVIILKMSKCIVVNILIHAYLDTQQGKKQYLQIILQPANMIPCII
jgi:hypothetical protein